MKLTRISGCDNLLADWQATLAESAATLTTQQRAVEEKARRLTAAENRAAAFEAEATRLRSQLEAMEDQLSRLKSYFGAWQELTRSAAVLKLHHCADKVQMQQRLLLPGNPSSWSCKSGLPACRPPSAIVRASGKGWRWS